MADLRILTHATINHVHAVLRREQPGHVGGAARGADRIHTVGVRKSRPACGQPINVGRADIRIAVASERPGPLVVGRDKKGVWLHGSLPSPDE